MTPPSDIPSDGQLVSPVRQCFLQRLAALNVKPTIHAHYVRWAENCANNRAFLTSLDLSFTPLLSSITCTNCKLTTLDVTGLPLLTTLNCSSCSLTSLTVAGLTVLTTLDCSDNSLTALDLSGLTALYSFNGMSNTLSPTAMNAMWLSPGECRMKTATKSPQNPKIATKPLFTLHCFTPKRGGKNNRFSDRGKTRDPLWL